jgi:hypothetical protein
MGDRQWVCRVPMRIEIQHPSSKSQRLSVKAASLLGAPKLLLNDQESRQFRSPDVGDVAHRFALFLRARNMFC